MIDNLIAFRILYKLVTPFNETRAFKLGIIDAKGKLLKQVNTLTADEKVAYDMLDRLVFNLKRLIGKLPGGESKLANVAAAYFLVKENIDCKTVDIEYLEEQLQYLSTKILVEEMLTVLNFIRVFEDAPANSTGPAVSTDKPVINKKRIHRFNRSDLKRVIVP